VLIEVVGTVARVRWDEGQDQTGAPDGVLREFASTDWLALEVVHLLWHGLPLCGFTLEMPCDWPDGHVWTTLRSEVSCTGCARRAGEHRP